MQNAEKKLAAALAAIELYMRAEIEAAEAARLEVPAPAAPRAAEPGLWAQSGRMEMMTARRMVQLRAFSGGR
jgi:hypothetical protein